MSFEMIVTHVTARGAQGYVFLTRAEGPLRIIIEKSVHPNGYRILHGTMPLTGTLDDLYRLLSSLLYGERYPERWQAAELEALVRPLLREAGMNSTGIGVS